MGMRTYCTFDYGVLFEKSDLDMTNVRKHFADSIDAGTTDDDIELFDFFDGETDCSYYGNEFEGEGFTLKDDECINVPSEFVLGSVSHFPSFYKASYEDYDALKADLIKKFGTFLKVDFEWDKKIVKLVGTTFG